jgi:hypothetical protein
MPDSPPRKRRRHGRVEQAAEHVVDSVRDGIRRVELALDEGDHTPVGELAGLVGEALHPEGRSEGGPEPVG